MGATTRRYLTGAVVALEFLTPLRFRRVPQYDDHTFAESLGWYPLVGLLIGLALLLVDRGLERLLPPSPVAAIEVALLALLSGGLHLDGVADTADGMAYQGDRAGRLGVMSEGNTGPAGVMALVIVLLAMWAALASLEPSIRGGALVLAPALARWTVVPVALLFKPARPRGLGRLMHEAAWPVAAPLATATVIIAAVVLFGAAGGMLDRRRRRGGRARRRCGIAHAGWRHRRRVRRRDRGLADRRLVRRDRRCRARRDHAVPAELTPCPIARARNPPWPASGG